ncbi:hypothetical protein PZH32_13155, partial [Adlercreutzia equolifaciens]|uniref:hypothetical protein n=1 Tax=Adlercreutzia equolifaciens TaxID=446660 RepID=UPI0023AEC0FD
DGSYEFANLPTRHTVVRHNAEGVLLAATEYLAGYTVEVQGNDDSAEQSMNGMPATRMQVNVLGQEGFALDATNDPLNSKVVSASANTSSLYAAGNSPLR